MKIKNRLALYFTLISACILLLVMVVVYLVFVTSLRNDFYHRLKDRLQVTAKLYLEADELSKDSLEEVRSRYLVKLSDEVIRIYDFKNSAAFISDDQQYWSNKVINRVRYDGSIKYFEDKNQVVGIYYRDNQGDFVILGSARDTGSEIRLLQLQKIMLIVFIVSNLFLFLIGRWLSRRILSPIDGLVSQMRKIRADSLETRVIVNNQDDEIGILAKNFNSLLEHLDNAFELQRTFVANASHELRTPITSIIGEAEVGLKRTRDEEEYRAILKSIITDADRLKDTITGLMELAQVDMDFTRAKLTPIRIDDLLWELQDYWTSKLKTPLFKLSIAKLPVDERYLILNANKALLFIAFNNIIANAFKFSENKPVECELYTDEVTMQIKFTDQGIGIDEEDRKKVMEPFYRSKNADKYPGSGIGLYVTRKIIELFGGTISIRSSLGTGSIVSINFVQSKIR